MIKIGKINLKTLSRLVKNLAKTKKLLWVIGENAFLAILVFILFALISGSVVFYKYSYLVEKTEPEAGAKPFQFEEKVYQKIIAIWQRQEKNLEEVSNKKYSDLFREKKEEVGPDSGAPEEPNPIVYIVKYGDTLWKISQKFLGSGERWREIKTEEGEILTEDTAEILPVGQRLIIPVK
ncbi:MAG: hypothetical protein COU98_02060 [Candidatus Staskawiczbacteria bacterium CG10_big_fil_rev_8_21_14_0_10_38_10]|uniref:LysM domain-containing protein n=1 Tax=Candidatus Staskawiczbacteria bacterium CG10_big_fil_rev_8_21_14_0_10_38_10 TaxID=1974891 RepID=A0A2H9T108_9BACT|nr:MAG: hypothetical protein COU98_02060 [Candidatus Staskawiczbacteria bacterium CG10_big_fil_rev_8_21_14_0_10_38_10]